ncbi:asparagine synthase-related protein [Salidesulfovibrio brasiliensis]|uniref:asparagine synthase-related protein n=1 Tax=Salidesulfovibrio brasiliensis TaxID=221711 RepID=UPI0009FA2DE8|nr:asparagine synthase-related protein [Salidesulfovibrio brasiliensis]
MMHLNNSHDLPRFIVSYTPSNEGHDDGHRYAFNAKGLKVIFENYNTSCFIHETTDTITVTLGHPMKHGRIDPKSISLDFAKGLTKKKLAEVNGEFLIIHLDKQKKTLSAATDRFTAIPLYYHVSKDGFVGSVFYNDLWKYLNEKGLCTHNSYAFYEFIYFQRLFGTKTYDKDSRFLRAASLLSYSDGKTSEESYWNQSYHKSNDSLDTSAHHLVHLLKQSIHRKTSDNPGRIGLFLSGGKDSRTILSCFDVPPTSFTLTPGKNHEFLSAAEAVAIRGGKHVHLNLREEPYSQVVDQLVQLGGGMHVFDHALFYGYGDDVREHADIVFHGHGVDYMFQGMYIPTKPLRIWGKTQWKHLQSIPNDISRFFIENISYKVKVVSPATLLKDNKRGPIQNELHSSIQELVDESSGFCNTPYDTWEYFLNHAISRHYPYTNLTSMGTCVEQRTLTFDNDIFNFYLSLPAKHRINAKLAISALQKADPRLGAIINNNTGMPANYHAWKRELYIIKRRLMKALGVWKSDRIPKGDSDRTWPHRLTLIQQHKTMNRLAMEAANSEAIDSLNLFDMDLLRKKIPEWIATPPHRHIGGIIYHLITIDRFLKQ